MKESTEEIQPCARKLPVDTQLRIVAGLAVVVAVTGALFLVINANAGLSRAPTPLASQTLGAFVPTRQQLASLGIETVNRRTFRTEIDTDGYIAPNSSFMVPNSSARNHIGRDMPVLVSQSSDMLQAESDFVTARAQFNLAQTTEKRQHELYKTQGAALKDWQQSQTDLATTAAALGSARNRLRILGKTDQEIEAFESSPKPFADSGTGSSDRVFSVGDLSTVWLIANVREADAALIHLGDHVQARVLAFPDDVFQATIGYVSSVIDPVTHRLVVGAKIRNGDDRLKPNMMAALTIMAGPAVLAPGVPLNAIIYEGDRTRVWIARRDGSLTPREITIGRTNGKFLEVTKGLAGGERIVTSGTLFVDQAGSEQLNSKNQAPSL